MRFRTLLATLVALLALPAAAHAAAVPFWSFDLDGTKAATYTAQPATANLTEGPDRYADVTAGGVARKVGDVLAGEGYAAGVSMLGSAYTLALTVDLADPSQGQRVLSVRGRDDARTLRLSGGRLQYVRAGDVTVDGTHAIGEGWTQVVMTRTAAGHVDVYVDGAHDLGFQDDAGDAIPLSVRVLNVAAAGAAAGHVGRIRLLKGALTAAEVAALRPFDADAPEIEVEWPAVAGGVRRAGPDRQWHGVTADDGDPEPAVRVRVENAAHEVVVAEHDAGEAIAARGEHGPERLWDGWWATTGGTLQHGATYDFVVRATDRWGHERETRFPFLADTVAPTPGVDPIPARVTDHTPTLAGPAGQADGDGDFVSVAICAGATCSLERGVSGEGLLVRRDAEVSGGRWRLEDVMVQGDEEDVPFEDGTYTLLVEQGDAAGNTGEVRRTFTIGPPLPAEEEPRPGGGGGAAPVSGPAPVPVPAPVPRSTAVTPVLAPAVVLDRLAGAVAKGLRAKGAKGLRAGVRLALAPARPGAVAVRVSDARGRVLAQGRLKDGALRLRAGARVARGRALTVVVRTTYTPAGGRPVSVDRRVRLRV